MSKGKLNVFLDIDNTLIQTIPLTEASSKYSNISSILEYGYFIPNHKDGMIVYKRPYLDEFLEYIFKHCNVSIFTHADKDYAKFIIDKFVTKGYKDRKIEYFFYRYHVEMGINKYKGYKDLRLLWNDFKIFDMNPCNTVLIDDHPDVLLSNIDNVIPIKKFDIRTYTTDEIKKDDELLKMINIIKACEIKMKEKCIKNPMEPLLKKI